MIATIDRSRNAGSKLKKTKESFMSPFVRSSQKGHVPAGIRAGCVWTGGFRALMSSAGHMDENSIQSLGPGMSARREICYTDALTW